MESDHNVETVFWKGLGDIGFNPLFAGSLGNQGGSRREARVVEWQSAGKWLFTHCPEFILFMYLSIVGTQSYIGYIIFRCENFYILATRWLSAHPMALGLLNLSLSPQIIRKVLFYILLHWSWMEPMSEKMFNNINITELRKDPWEEAEA